MYNKKEKYIKGYTVKSPFFQLDSAMAIIDSLVFLHISWLCTNRRHVSDQPNYTVN